jgi:hypothetical protein
MVLLSGLLLRVPHTHAQKFSPEEVAKSVVRRRCSGAWFKNRLRRGERLCSHWAHHILAEAATPRSSS